MSNDIQWTEDAQLRLAKIPFFIRGFAKRRVEKAAIEKGHSTITLDLLLEIKDKEMPKT